MAATLAIYIGVPTILRDAVGNGPLGPMPTSSPAASAGGVRADVTSFLRRFTYAVPERPMAEYAEGASMKGFVDGEPAPSATPAIYPLDVSGRRVLPGSRGVVVAVLNGPVTHPCPPSATTERTVAMREAPAEFLADLRDLGGFPIGEITPTTIDGRPAIAASVPDDLPEAGCWTEFHPTPFTGLSSPFVRLDIPSRLSVLDVDGLTVVIQIWATTEQDLADWADEFANGFVNSFEFDAP